MPAGAGVLRVDGPILKKHIDVFGAKLGLALHFEAHGSAVPPTGGVQPMFFTNVSALRGELPNEIFGLAADVKAGQAGNRRPISIFLGAHRGEEAQRFLCNIQTIFRHCSGHSLRPLGIS